MVKDPHTATTNLLNRKLDLETAILRHEGGGSGGGVRLNEDYRLIALDPGLAAQTGKAVPDDRAGPGSRIFESVRVDGAQAYKVFINALIS